MEVRMRKGNGNPIREFRFLLWIFVMALFLVNCERNETGPSVRTEVIDRIPHVYNTEVPLKGEISLKVKEVLRIDLSAIDKEEPPLIRLAAKDGAGNTYLADSRNVKVYKLDPGGRLVTTFLEKGQGPGEFPVIGDLQVFDDHVWIFGAWPMKIAKFSLDGEYIDEWKFPTFRNFYLRTLVVADDRFLTVSYREEGENAGRIRVSALINAEEEFLTRIAEDRNAGIFQIRTGEREGPATVSTNPLVASDIHHAYDRTSGFIYVCNNRVYEIQAKNRDGTTGMVIHRAHRNVILDDDTKESLLRSIAPRIPLEAKNQAKEQLPDTLNAIWGISILPHGHLAVKRITGLESVEIDVFDGNGRFIYTILPSAEIPDLRDVMIFENTIGIIVESEEKNSYVEYGVKNLKEIFD
jgi:hypothetical protein